MECKLVLLSNLSASDLIKVEPYWNVNNKEAMELKITNFIKVEPYWNVNFSKRDNDLCVIDIKVEPYWNVNIREVEVFPLYLKN